MPRNATDIHDLLSALLLRAQSLAATERLTELKVSKLQERLRSIQRQRIEIDNQIRDTRIRHISLPLPTNAPPTLKNMDFLRAWSAVRESLAASDDGLPQHQVAKVIELATPGIAGSTIRSQLHRLKQRGLIEKIGSAWHLTSKGRAT